MCNVDQHASMIGAPLLHLFAFSSTGHLVLRSYWRSQNVLEIEKLESQDMVPTSNEKMKMTNTEKLKTKKPVFSYDPHTKGKDFI